MFVYFTNTRLLLAKIEKIFILNVFFCVGVMYSGEYDACDVTLIESVYPHRASLKNMPDTVGIEPTTFGILAPCSAN